MTVLRIPNLQDFSVAMEALGLVANIAVVIQLAAQVTQLSYSYVQEVKNAPKIQKKYLQEVSAFDGCSFPYRTDYCGHGIYGLLPPRPASLDDDALMDCYKELSHLHFELQKRKSRLLRPFQDKELRPHIEMLHKFRENFPSIFLLVSCLYDDAFLHVLFR